MVRQIVGRMRRLTQRFADAFAPRLGMRMRALHAQRTLDPELGLLPSLVDPDGSAVDVGASRGVYTWPLARLARKVYAVEPNPALASRLQRGFGANVEVLECALSKAEGETTLWIPAFKGQDLVGRSSVRADANPGFDTRQIEVPLRTLDSLGLDDCGFVKLHVEGHEVDALRGAQRTIERCRPTILVAGQVRFAADLADQIFAFLSGFGYHGYFLQRGQIRPFRCFDPKVHQRPESVPKPGSSEGLSADFIYNFIYVNPAREAVLRALEPLMTDECEPRAAPSGLAPEPVRETAGAE